jgi:hypothetical protein
MSVKGQEPISATTGSVEELRDAGRAGFEWLFERRGGTTWPNGDACSLEQ